jgi:hypothetical protein
MREKTWWVCVKERERQPGGSSRRTQGRWLCPVKSVQDWARAIVSETATGLSRKEQELTESALCYR